MSLLLLLDKSRREPSGRHLSVRFGEVIALTASLSRTPFPRYASARSCVVRANGGRRAAGGISWWWLLWRLCLSRFGLRRQLITLVLASTGARSWFRLRRSMDPLMGLVEPFSECFLCGVIGGLSLPALLPTPVSFGALFGLHVALWLSLDLVMMLNIHVRLAPASPRPALPTGHDSLPLHPSTRLTPRRLSHAHQGYDLPSLPKIVASWAIRETCAFPMWVYGMQNNKVNRPCRTSSLLSRPQLVGSCIISVFERAEDRPLFSLRRCTLVLRSNGRTPSSTCNGAVSRRSAPFPPKHDRKSSLVCPSIKRLTRRT